jgi:hypothetical protein
MTIYHIIYKTVSLDGKYYIGRHTTTNLNDTYFGSGNWVESIRDKSSLRREILDSSSTTIEELKLLETKFIEQYFDDPLNMNELKSGAGYTRELALERVAKGTHNFVTGKYAKQRLLEGKHNFQIDNPVYKQVANGTHHFQTNHPSKIKMTCEYCGRTLGKPLFLRWHGENCKLKK